MISIQDIQNWFKKRGKQLTLVPKEPYKNIDPKGEYIQPENDSENHMMCPHCHHTQWISGPEGGGSENIKCSNCGWWYNYMGYFGLTFLGETD